jgi:DNA replicative helicase MCM subunit Mcm2 (Cdc46/Mcm family)
VNENLKMSAALLSRFDLVFILLDKPDEVLDKRVSDHIISVSYPVWHMVVHSFALKTCYDIQGESVLYH